MKYIFCRAFALSAALCFGLSGCGKQADSNSDASSVASAGRDYSVTPEIAYDVPSEDSVFELTNMELDYAFDTSFATVSEHASLMVEGEIQKITYTSLEKGAWTQLDVCVTSCEYGDFVPGDVISVYTLGGYIPMREHFSDFEIKSFYPNMTDSEIDNAMLLSQPDGAPLPTVGESYLFLLGSAGGSLPKDAYETCLGYAYALYEEDGDAFVNAKTEERISTDTLEQAVDEKEA